MRIASFCFAVAACVLVNAEEKPLYLSIDTPPAPTLTAAQARAAFRLAPGFAIEAVAAEPLVEDPVALTWDEAGRMYVAEMRSYMQDTHGTNQKAPIGTVVRLVDHDGDGRMDERQVLLDGLVLPRAVAVVNEGLLIAEPPNLWLCPSASGLARDIDCREKRRLGTYGDQPGSVEHAENGLLAGLDNWLYSAKSARRLRIQNGQLVEEPTLFRGQWGITEDDQGRLYYNTNSNLLSGDYYSAQNVVAAGGKRAEGLNARVSKDDALFAVRVNTGVNRAYLPGVLREDGRLNQPTSASGMAVYLGDQFGPEHRSDVFVAEPAANAVVRLVLDESEFEVDARHIRYPDLKWTQREFLASTDERFRPVNVYTGPDGALYIVDFYRGVIQDHVFISEQLRKQAEERKLDRPPGLGRIWRVSAVERPSRATDLESASSEALIDHLRSPNGWTRRTAQRLLLQKPSRQTRREVKRLLETEETPGAIHALWLLDGWGELTRRSVLRAAAAENEGLAIQALLAGRDLLRQADALQFAESDRNVRFRLEAIGGLALHNAQADVRAAAAQLLETHWQHPPSRQALIAAMRGQETRWLVELAEAGAWSPERDTQTGLVTALAEQHMRLFADDGETLSRFLDVVAGSDWMAKPLLQGVANASRQEGFERAKLPQAHVLFTDPLADESLWPLVARARQAFTWPGDTLAAGDLPMSAAQRENLQAGRDYYAARCATCHGADGQGISALAPSLVDSPWVVGVPERLARIVLHGVQGPIEVDGVTWNLVMPGHALVPEFTDAVASGLLNHLARSWGHAGHLVEADFVTQVRADTAARTQPFTVAELEQVPINTHYRAYDGRYGGGPMLFSFRYDGQGALLIETGLFSGPLENRGNDRFFFQPRNITFDFERNGEGRVARVVMRSPGETGRPIPRVGPLDG